jgi:iron complex transport system substrate-binding protein
LIGLRTLMVLWTVFAVAGGEPLIAQPRRIVSINPCVDAVLVEVADPQQILAVSHYSQDARATSIPLATAWRFAATSGTAEEVVALRPDIVLAGAHVSPSTLAALKRLKVPVQTFTVPESVAESVAQVRAIAAAAGHPERGETLVRRIEAAIARARRIAAQEGAPVPALIWQGSGLVPGENTLADELLRTAGFRNMSAAYGLKRWDVLPLEHLAARPPRVLLSDRTAGDRMTGHRVLRRFDGMIMRPQFDERLLSCAGPVIVRALDRLSAVRASL